MSSAAANWERHSAASRTKFSSPIKSLLTQLLISFHQYFAKCLRIKKSWKRRFASFCFSFCKYNGGARWQTVRKLFLEHGRVHDAHFVTHAAVCLFHFVGILITQQASPVIIKFLVRNAHSIAEHWSGPTESLWRESNLTIDSETKRVADTVANRHNN